MPPRVSIVLPVHNGERYLAEAVRSCCDQTWQDWELILADDASTDRSPQLVAEAAARDARVRPLRLEPNRRLPGALNAGFRMARGELLTWTSDDNLYRPAALAEMVAALDARAEADIVYADYTILPPAPREPFLWRVGEVRDLLQITAAAIGACFLFRRRVLRALGGYAEDLFLAEDYDFWLRAAIRFTFLPLHKDLYLYRWHEGSLTQRRAAERRAAGQRALRRSLRRLPWATKREKAERYLFLARQARARGDYATALACRWWAWRYAPGLGWKAARPGGEG